MNVLATRADVFFAMGIICSNVALMSRHIYRGTLFGIAWVVFAILIMVTS